MSFMFESSTISIISKITVETITKATKVVIESIEKEFATEVATEVATKSIEEEVVSNEKESNWRNIFNNVALSIEAETIEATKAIEATNATNATEATMNESTTSSDWDDDSDWDSDSDTESRDDRESRIDESRSAEILSLSLFLTRDLRTDLSISLRKKAEAFVSRLNRRFVMFRKKC